MRPALALLALLVLPFSGCASPCQLGERRFAWQQDDVPVAPLGSESSWRFGDYNGTVWREGETIVLVQHRAGSSISHAEGVDKARHLFAQRGWPEPRLDGAQESARCVA